MKQFITSLQDCQDIVEPRQFEFKLIKKDEPCTEAVEAEKESYHQESLINGNQVEVGVDQVGKNIDVEPESTRPVVPQDPHLTISTSSHETHDDVGDNCHREMTSAGYKLFPFDNPLRLEMSGSDESPKILSLPFPSTFPSKGQTEEGLSPKPKARLPSVSRILNLTMPPEQVEVLKKWEQKMIQQMGEEGFRLYKEGEKSQVW